MDERMRDSVISTRVRLARNLKGYPFPLKITREQARLVENKVFGAMGQSYRLYSIRALGEAEAGALMEKHLVSKELLRSRFGSVVVSDDESSGIMLNEEDHIRIQVILKGLKLSEAYAIADGIDDRIAERAEYAFSEKLGYLTACPTNLGTGMRASAMMFLPALTMVDALMESIKTLGMMNITVRGVYGEGSKAEGFTYQISNQRTLGMTEREILMLVEEAVNRLSAAEARAREYLIENRESEVKDEICRAYGIAANAYRLTNEEFTRYNALIKLGAYYELYKVSSVTALDELATAVHPYTLMATAGSDVRTEDELNIYRAKTVRDALKGIIIK